MEVPATFVRQHTRIERPALVPEIRLHVADDVVALWEAMEQERVGPAEEPPFWAAAWPGGQALARYVLDHPEVVIKTMNHRFKLGRNRVALELRVLHAILDAIGVACATRVFNHGTDEGGLSWLVRERVFDVEPRGAQADRTALIERILRLYPSADVSLFMLPDPKFDNVRWGYTEDDPEPRWILTFSLAFFTRPRAMTFRAFLLVTSMISCDERATTTLSGLAESTRPTSKSSLSVYLSCSESRMPSSLLVSFSTPAGRSMVSSGPG